MSKLKYNAQVIGDELVQIRPHAERLIHGEHPLLGSDRPHIEDSSPNWYWRIKATVYVAKTDIDTMNAYITTIKAYCDGQGKQTLYVRNDADSATIATYTNCRLDSIYAPEDGQPAHSRRARMVLIFSSASDGT